MVFPVAVIVSAAPSKRAKRSAGCPVGQRKTAQPSACCPRCATAAQQGHSGGVLRKQHHFADACTVADDVAGRVHRPCQDLASAHYKILWPERSWIRVVDRDQEIVSLRTLHLRISLSGCCAREP